MVFASPATTRAVGARLILSTVSLVFRAWWIASPAWVEGPGMSDHWCFSPGVDEAAHVVRFVERRLFVLKLQLAEFFEPRVPRRLILLAPETLGVLPHYERQAHLAGIVRIHEMPGVCVRTHVSGRNTRSLSTNKSWSV
jgi:hypothetical protein